MKFKINNKEFNQLIGKFLEGGVAPAPEEAPELAAPEQGGSPEELIMMACLQALQSQDCNLAMQVCLALLQMTGGGGAPAELPAEPVYRRGGILVKRIKN